jgi:ubiquinone/menaquinone biosynthesis C-methylase UbiE
VGRFATQSASLIEPPHAGSSSPATGFTKASRQLALRPNSTQVSANRSRIRTERCTFLKEKDLARAGHRIEILGEELIDQHPDLAMDVLGISSRLALPLGWHYLLDLVWVLSELEESGPRAEQPPFTVLEVGAGTGLLQFLLADRGYDVISADMRNRDFAPRFRACYEFSVIAEAREIQHPYLAHLGDDPRSPRQPKSLGRAIRSLLKRRPAQRKHQAEAQPPDDAGRAERPRIQLYRCNAEAMTALEDDCIDATLSISALEHNEPESIAAVQREVERVTRPGGFCLHTTSAIKKGRSFHAPSHSHLMDDAELARTYGLDTYESNWSDWDALERDFQQPRRLARWLSHTYFQSGRNGMPWGVWRPEYLPVGLRKEL